MASINFFNEDSNYILKDKKIIRQWIANSIIEEDKTLEQINIIFCSDEYLYELNTAYLNHDTLTDIITFQYNEDKELIHSDIFISIDRVKENAKEYRQSIKNELHRMIIHGTLHLCGYKDKKPTEKNLMTSKENYYLNKLDLK